MTAKIFNHKEHKAHQENLCGFCALWGAVLIAAKAALRHGSDNS
jgi:hypothetical protein